MTELQQFRMAKFMINVDERLDTTVQFQSLMMELILTLLPKMSSDAEIKKQTLQILLLQQQEGLEVRKRNREQVKRDLGID
jgi:hypothetical protein